MAMVTPDGKTLGTWPRFHIYRLGVKHGYEIVIVRTVRRRGN